MTSGVLAGAAAGAAGTTALNAISSLDMVIRGRASSSAPRDLVEAAAGRIGVDIPGDGKVRDNRLAGLAPLSGTAVGVVVGAAAGAAHKFLRKHGRRTPAPIAVLAISATAMALSDVPLKVFGISDPADWGRTDWVSDIVPHLVFGVTTYATIQGLEQGMEHA